MLGVILAGGLSTRMGSDKALLEVSGQRVLLRSLTLLQAVCGDVCVVARDQSQTDSLKVSARILTDCVSECGPLGGLHTAFQASGEDLLVLACDLPFVEQRTLERLVAAFKKTQPRVLLPRTQENGAWRDQPLCAVWSRNCKDDVATAVHARRLALYRLIQSCPAVERLDIPAQDAAQFRNVNSLQDLPHDSGNPS